jgi:hypothetical protein
MRATCSVHIILLDLIVLIIFDKEYKLWKTSFCNFLYPPVISTLFGNNRLLSNLFSNTLNLCSSPNVRDHVSHPYKTTCKTIVFFVLISTIFDIRQKDERFWKWMTASIRRNYSVHNFLINVSLIYFCRPQTFIWSLSHFQRIYYVRTFIQSDSGGFCKNLLKWVCIKIDSVRK